MLPSKYPLIPDDWPPNVRLPTTLGSTYFSEQTHPVHQAQYGLGAGFRTHHVAFPIAALPTPVPTPFETPPLHLAGPGPSHPPTSQAVANLPSYAPPFDPTFDNPQTSISATTANGTNLTSTRPAKDFDIPTAFPITDDPSYALHFAQPQAFDSPNRPRMSPFDPAKAQVESQRRIAEAMARQMAAPGSWYCPEEAGGASLAVYGDYPLQTQPQGPPQYLGYSHQQLQGIVNAQLVAHGHGHTHNPPHLPPSRLQPQFLPLARQSQASETTRISRGFNAGSYENPASSASVSLLGVTCQSASHTDSSPFKPHVPSGHTASATPQHRDSTHVQPHAGPTAVATAKAVTDTPWTSQAASHHWWRPRSAEVGLTAPIGVAPHEYGSRLVAPAVPILDWNLGPGVISSRPEMAATSSELDEVGPTPLNSWETPIATSAPWPAPPAAMTFGGRVSPISPTKRKGRAPAGPLKRRSSHPQPTVAKRRLGASWLGGLGTVFDSETLELKPAPPPRFHRELQASTSLPSLSPLAIETGMQHAGTFSGLGSQGSASSAMSTPTARRPANPARQQDSTAHRPYPSLSDNELRKLMLGWKPVDELFLFRDLSYKAWKTERSTPCVIGGLGLLRHDPPQLVLIASQRYEHLRATIPFNITSTRCGQLRKYGPAADAVFKMEISDAEFERYIRVDGEMESWQWYPANDDKYPRPQGQLSLRGTWDDMVKIRNRFLKVLAASIPTPEQEAPGSGTQDAGGGATPNAEPTADPRYALSTPGRRPRPIPSATTPALRRSSEPTPSMSYLGTTISPSLLRFAHGDYPAPTPSRFAEPVQHDEQYGDAVAPPTHYFGSGSPVMPLAYPVAPEAVMPLAQGYEVPRMPPTRSISPGAPQASTYPAAVLEPDLSPLLFTSARLTAPGFDEGPMAWAGPSHRSVSHQAQSPPVAERAPSTSGASLPFDMDVSVSTGPDMFMPDESWLEDLG